ncbi:MAG: hypothetical protein ACREH6_09525, partial [Geminicoccaceae bacterium]
LSDFALGWRDEHDLSEPLTGAVFDILVDVFHENLLDRGLITPRVEDLFDRLERQPGSEAIVQALFDDAYPRRRDGFKDALRAARDYLGLCLAATWERLPADFLNYLEVGAALLEVDREVSGGRYRRAILNSLAWREIGTAVVGPRLLSPDAESHLRSVRTLAPERQRRLPRLTYHERWQLAHRGHGRNA